jgi:hypothetical protein
VAILKYAKVATDFVGHTIAKTGASYSMIGHFMLFLLLTVILTRPRDWLYIYNKTSLYHCKQPIINMIANHCLVIDTQNIVTQVKYAFLEEDYGVTQLSHKNHAYLN